MTRPWSIWKGRAGLTDLTYSERIAKLVGREA